VWAEFVSHVLKFWRLGSWAKGAQNSGEKVDVFVTRTMKSFFFVTGQIGMKFGQKRQSVCFIEL